jgi:hypothetical protein
LHLLLPVIALSLDNHHTAAGLQDGCFQLHSELWVNVLQHVELQQRLGSCSLVCRAWRSAAAAATPGISITLQRNLNLTLPPPQQVTSLEAWLRKHGRQASSLAAAWGDFDNAWFSDNVAPERPGLHLPCQQLGQLQTLKARDMLLLPDAAASAAAADVCMRADSSHREASSSSSAVGQAQPAHSLQFLSGLSSLTSLQLTRCSISGWAGGLRGLSQLTQLQHLQLAQLHAADVEINRNTQQISAELAGVLPYLVQLTYLDVRDSVSAAALEGLGQLQQLRELRLQGCEDTGSVIAQLPASLTLLGLNLEWDSDPSSDVVLDVGNTARLRQLQGLLELHLPQVTVRDMAGLLGALTQLTSLTLDGR